MQDVNGSGFDTRAATWDTPQRKALAEAVLAGLLGRVKIEPEWRVLDFGAGTGLMALPLAQRCTTVVAADSSAGMLDVLRGKLADGAADRVHPVLLADGEVPPGPFDLIVATMVLHHIEDVKGLLGRFHAVLASGGLLAVFDLEEDGGEFHGPGMGVHHDGFSTEGFSGWLAEAGFGDIGIETVYSMQRVGRTGKLCDFPIFLALGRRDAGFR